MCRGTGPGGLLPVALEAQRGKSKVNAALGGPSKRVPFLYIFADTLVVDEPFLPSPSTTTVARALSIEGATPLVAPDPRTVGISGVCSIQLLTQQWRAARCSPRPPLPGGGLPQEDLEDRRTGLSPRPGLRDRGRLRDALQVRLRLRRCGVTRSSMRNAFPSLIAAAALLGAANVGSSQVAADDSMDARPAQEAIALLGRFPITRQDRA